MTPCSLGTRKSRGMLAVEWRRHINPSNDRIKGFFRPCSRQRVWVLFLTKRLRKTCKPSTLFRFTFVLRRKKVCHSEINFWNTRDVEKSKNIHRVAVSPSETEKVHRKSSHANGILEPTWRMVQVLRRWFGKLREEMRRLVYASSKRRTL